MLRATPLEADGVIYGIGTESGKADAYKDVIKKTLEKAVLERRENVVFYYPEEVPELSLTKGSMLLDDQVCALAYTWYYLSGKNDYGEQISVMGRPMYKYDYRFDYNYSAKEQKEYLAKRDKILGRLKKAGGSDGNAVETVNEFNRYFTENCVYDNTLEKGDPYDAIVGGVAVCDGYSKAAYMLLNMVGVPCEYVYGQGLGSMGWLNHSWNIVKVGSKWYLCDFTWNSQLKDLTYMLKGTGNAKFRDTHVLAKKFRTEKWKKEHPMAVRDYRK